MATTTFHAHLLASTCARSLSLSPTPGTVIWNSLPRMIRCIVVPSAFKRLLKVELFSRAYDVSRDISDDQTVTYVKRIRIRVRCHPLLSHFYLFLLYAPSYISTLLSIAVHILWGRYKNLVD